MTQIPAPYRRDLLITVDGAGATKALVDHITALNSRPGHRVQHYIGWDFAGRERTAVARVPTHSWGAVLDSDGAPRDLGEAGVVELTGLLRRGPHGDELANWPADMRIIGRRERPHPGAQLSLFEEIDGWRYQLFATNTPHANDEFLEARHRAHARVEDNIRTGKQTGLGHLPSTSIEVNRAWCLAAAIACDLLCWLRLLCLTGPLTTPSPRPCATGCCTPPPASSTASANARSASPRPGPGRSNWPLARSPPSPYPHQPDIDQPRPRPENHPEPWNPAPTRRDSRALSLTRTLTTTSTNQPKINTRGPASQPATPMNDQGQRRRTCCHGYSSCVLPRR